MEPKVPFSTNTFTYIMTNQKALVKYIKLTKRKLN